MQQKNSHIIKLPTNTHCLVETRSYILWECWCNNGLWCQCAGIVGVRISVDSDSGVKSDNSEVTS